MPQAQFVLRQVSPVDRPDEFRRYDRRQDSSRKRAIEHRVPERASQAHHSRPQYGHRAQEKRQDTHFDVLALRQAASKSQTSSKQGTFTKTNSCPNTDSNRTLRKSQFSIDCFDKSNVRSIGATTLRRYIGDAKKCVQRHGTLCSAELY